MIGQIQEISKLVSFDVQGQVMSGSTTYTKLIGIGDDGWKFGFPGFWL